MANSKDFIAHVLEMIEPAGRPSARAMFGGHGVYVDAMIVAIAIDDVLYLKTDAQTRPAFLAEGLSSFQYVKQGEAHDTGYYRPPDEALESPDAMREWLRLALGAALRSAGRKKPKPATTAPRKRK